MHEVYRKYELLFNCNKLPI